MRHPLRTHPTLILHSFFTHSATITDKTSKPNTATDGGDAVARRGGPWRPVSSGGPRRVLSPFPRCLFPQVPSFCVRKTEAGGAARRLTYYPNMGAVWVGTPYGEFPKVFLNARSLGTKTLPHFAFSVVEIRETC